MRPELSTQEHYWRSQMDHPAGREYKGPHYDGRVAGCMGERTNRTAPHRKQEPSTSLFEAWLAVIALVLVVAAVVSLVVAQVWRFQGVPGLFAVAAVVAGVVVWARRRR